MTERISASRPYAEVEQTRLLRSESERAKKPEDRKADSVADRDEVQISTAAMKMQYARDAVEAAPAVRKDVVERLRREIATGDYEVNTLELGRRMYDVLA